MVDFGAVEFLEVRIKFLSGFFLRQNLPLMQLLQNNGLVLVHPVYVVEGSSLLPLKLSDLGGMLSFGSLKAGPVDSITSLDSFVFVCNVNSVAVLNRLELSCHFGLEFAELSSMCSF